MQKIKLSKGVVTQNGNYVSYKTGIINNDIPLFQKLADELKTFLDTKNILYTYPFESFAVALSPCLACIRTLCQ